MRPSSSRPHPAPARSRRAALGMLGKAGITLLAASQLFDPLSPSRVLSGRWHGVKRPLVGLVDRNPHSTRHFHRTSEYIDAFVGQVEWREIEPTLGNYNAAPVDALIAEAATYGKRLRLRVYLGIHVVDRFQPVTAAPDYAVREWGTVEVYAANWGPSGVRGRSLCFWRDGVLERVEALYAALSAWVEHVDIVADIHGAIGALIGGETMITRCNPNKPNLLAAGYDHATDIAVQKAGMDAFARQFARTGFCLPANRFQRIDDGDGECAADGVTLELLNYGVTALGTQFRPGQHSMAMDEHYQYGKPDQQFIYDWMRDARASGLAPYIQTYPPGKDGPESLGGGTHINYTVSEAAEIATCVELPWTYSVPPNPAKLQLWHALFTD